MRKNRKFTILSIITTITLFAGGTVFNVCQGKYVQKAVAAEDINNEINRNPIEKIILNSMDWPKELNYQNKEVKIEYNFNDTLMDYTKNLLKQYRSDYTTVTVIDNETGKVLAAVGYQGKSNQFDKNLVLSSTHPSASLIKLVTAADLIQNGSVKKDTTFDFRGRSTTLFKYQLNDSKGRSARTQTFETAFAKSNNVIFGKAAIKNSSSDRIVKMAENFGFNQPIMKEFSYLKSEIKRVNDDFELAELASGFNIDTIINPIHAATLASVVANDGILKTPKLISKITDKKTGENIWSEVTEEKRVISPETSHELQELMAMTIDGGTARKSFRVMKGGYKSALEIGGKTGHITGGTPFGKRDWFTVYALPRDKAEGKGISISVMNVNVKRWHVKSAVLAKSIIEYYFKNVKPIALNSYSDTVSKRVPASYSKKKKAKAVKKVTRSRRRQA